MKRILWSTAILSLLFDRLTKWLVVQRMQPLQSIPVVPGVFHLTYVRNPGAAFGLLAGQRVLFLAITAGVLAFVAYYSRFVREKQVALQIALGLQVGGAVGNLIDRLASGLVIDFLDFRVFPVFNVADSAIVVGTGLLVLLLLRSPEELTAQEI